MARNSISVRRSVAACLGLPLLIAVTAPVAEAAQQAADQELGEVIVTGSRIGRSGFDSAQPLSVVDQAQIENLGIVNVGEVLRTLPQNTAFFTETNVGIGNFNVGAQLANLRGLNPFFGTRTLTLVDTKRVVPNTEGGAADLTLVPSMLVARTEIVTGGASAAYGSDAIAGVVNVILDTKLEGFKAQLDYGQTGRSDGNDRHASAAWGHGFADDRVHVLVGAEYQKQDAIGPCSQNRDWCRDSWLVGTNAGFASGNGNPNFVVAPGGKFSTSENGIIAPCLNAGCAPGAGRGAFQSFNAAGTALVPYNPGQYPGGFAARIGGDGTILAYDESSIRPAIERRSLLGHADIKLSDSMKLSLELANSHSESSNYPANGALGPFGGGVLIKPDNAYLTTALRAALPFGGVINRVFAPGVVSAKNTTKADTNRFVTTLAGELPGSWSWDAYYQYGKSTYHQQLIHNADLSIVGVPAQYSFFAWATDAVFSPSDPTKIVCRATIANTPAYNPLAAGCVPLNFFGVGNASQAAIDYVWRTLKEDSDYRQNVLGLNFRGELWDGWGAGPISGAIGGEFRSDKSDVTHDIANQPWYTSYLLSWSGDRGGKIDVAEAYAEVEVPVVKGLETNLAVRQTHNKTKSVQSGVASTSHDFASWKLGATYEATSNIRLRGTRSRDVRGAGFRELFLPRLQQQGTPGGFPAGIQNPWNGNIEEAYTSITGGNPNLKPEVANTTALGVVFNVDRLRFSADWYEIDLKGAISSASAQGIVQSCHDQGQIACQSVVTTGTGTSTNIISVESGTINLASYLTRGIDFEASYNMPLDSGSNLSLRLVSSYLYDMIINTGLGDKPINYHGQSGPVASFGGFNTSPDWQATAWLTYSRPRFTTTLETKYIGPGSLDARRFESPIGSATNTQINSISDNSVSSRVYFTWSGSYDFMQKSEDGYQLQLFWAVNNLFDKNPPVAPGGNAFPTNPVFFDTLGRRYRAGLRLQF
ncbi:MAG: TonB-dependent receptor [Steroidobacteraceae bacterium]